MNNDCQQYNEKTGKWETAVPLPFYRDGRPWWVRIGHVFYVLGAVFLLKKDGEEVDDKLMEKWWVKERTDEQR